MQRTAAGKARTRCSSLLGLSSLVGLLLAVGCGGEEDATSETNDAGGGAEVSAAAGAVVGSGCVKNDDCAAGLFCMRSDFAPAGWCTALCDNPGDYCTAPAVTTPNGKVPAGGEISALCIQMPADFRGPDKPFCARQCDNTLQCTDVWASWESCVKPAYKNTPLYNGLPTKVCMAPGSHGQVQVDPQICDWQAKVTQPQFQSAKQVCKAYCDYLKSCQLFDANKENIDCCTWRCFQKMTPSGAVDDTVEDALKCYITAFFNAYARTPEVCTGPGKDCGEPDPMAAN